MHRHVIASLFAAAVLAAPLVAQDPDPRSWEMKLGGEDPDVGPGSIVPTGDVALGNVLLPELAGSVTGGAVVPEIQLRGGNTQVNDPTQDYIQIFTGFRPFVHAIQSEVSTAARGRNIVVTYNNSAGIHVSQVGTSLVVDRVQLSGFSTSNDGGQSWTSGFFPNATGASLGDPSIGVDRNGNFYFANLDAAGLSVNKSTDGGNTWNQSVTVQVDAKSDKEWLAVGPDPMQMSRDNVYVTWTSFQTAACELRFGRSTDGGASFTSKTIFVPTANANPKFPQNCLQFTNIVVDRITGTIYIPFLRFSNADQDFLQMMVSNDAGETFHFATFNVPGAPSPTVYPVTQPGELTACGGTNIRLTIRGTANPGPGRFGFPRYINASRLTLQPAAAARNGVVYIAWSNSTSLVYGDPASHSNIMFLRSDDGGNTWRAPVIVNPILTNDIQHVLPALAIDNDSNDVHITYYTQHANRSVDLDMANSHDGGATFPVDRTLRVSSESFNLPPSNIPLTGAPNFTATNFDRQIAVCYALGEYQSVTTADGTVYASWGDMRNLIKEPVNALNPISGQVHPEPDVFFQKVKAQ